MAWRSRGHRGDTLEDLILLTNDYYKRNDFARVDKIATPIKVSEINKFGQITLGYFEKKSTVDFIGLAQGVPFCFDAKETKLKSMPISNIHEHQIEYMRDFKKQGGLSFMIFHYITVDKYFLVPLETIEQYIENIKNGGRKSIPHTDLKESYEISMFDGKMLNYLPCLNVYLQESKG